jgi:hypothetical protein
MSSAFPSGRMISSFWQAISIKVSSRAEIIVFIYTNLYLQKYTNFQESFGLTQALRLDIILMCWR